MSEEVNRALRDWLKRSLPKQSIICMVKSVDESEFTCDVIPVDGSATMYGVRLKPVIDSDASGLIAIPEDDSDVIVAIVDNNDNHAYVSVVGKVKKFLIKTQSGAVQQWKDDGTIEMNGDGYGGLIIIQKLVQKINSLEQKHNAHILQYNLHVHSVSGAVTLVPTPPDTQNNIIPITTQQELENTTVKHGGGI